MVDGDRFGSGVRPSTPPLDAVMHIAIVFAMIT
jgi:hypothetical protein